jgi:hypothetical protein
LQEVPAASGIERIGNDFYAVGDNSPWLYMLDSQYKVINKYHVSPGSPVTDEALPKNIKPDFEAITTVEFDNKKELWIFGSGSKSPSRDLLVRFDYVKNTLVKTYSLTEFYREIVSTCNLGDGMLNLEAAASSGKSLFLLNRGDNLVLQYDLKAMMDYLDGNSKCPKPLAYRVKLPQTENVQVGFSGATTSSDKENLIFTASAENTENWIDDGEILGSYVGVINLKKLKKTRISRSAYPLQKKVKRCPSKSNPLP